MGLFSKIKTLSRLLKNLALLPQMASDTVKMEKRLAQLESNIALLAAGGKASPQNILTNLAKWHKANLCNQISLANKVPGRRMLYTPWEEEAKNFFLEFDEAGRICFLANPTPAATQRRIFFDSIPKSGTYFLIAILAELGFQHTGVHGDGVMCADWKNHPGKSDTGVHFFLPLAVQIPLLRPNQLLTAHITSYEHYLNIAFQKDDALLISIRDLRYCIVSWMRHRDKEIKKDSTFKSLAAYNSDDVCDFLTRFETDYLFNVARSHVELMKSPYKALVVRYEELMSHDPDIARPSMEAISRAVGCDVSQAISAVEKMRDTKTNTFTGDHVKLDDIWNDKAEEIFVAKGGDILNEKLGYPKRYTPVPAS